MIEFGFFPRSLQESGKFINQFPNENSLVCKDLLAAVCQNGPPLENGKEDDLLRRGPEWLPVTFNLNLELPLFLDHYLKRKERYGCIVLSCVAGVQQGRQGGRGGMERGDFSPPLTLPCLHLQHRLVYSASGR